jgi:precorrin-6B methylase 2
MESITRQSVESATQQGRPAPSKIMQVGMGFWTSKALLVAVQFRLFTLLAGGKKLSGQEIKSSLQLNAALRHVLDWLDVLVILGFLQREGVWEEAVYANSSEAELFLDKNKPGYMGGILQLANNRLYESWGHLEEGLKTGLPQNEFKGTFLEGGFEKMYEDPQRVQEFMEAMSSVQTDNFIILAKKFDFTRYNTIADIGGADGALSIQLCLHYPHLKCINFDLPQVKPFAEKKIEQFNLQDRIQAKSGDFFKDDLPKADVITMGNILHGLVEEKKQQVIQKVYDTLETGGAFIVIENIIDEERKQHMFGMLMSLNMLVQNGDGFDYMPSDFNRWTTSAGFSKTEFIPLAGPATAAIAYK